MSVGEGDEARKGAQRARSSWALEPESGMGRECTEIGAERRKGYAISSAPSCPALSVAGPPFARRARAIALTHHSPFVTSTLNLLSVNPVLS